MTGFSTQKTDSGNAMIYVLIVVALFAALSFVLSRNSGTDEQQTLSAEKINIYASQIIQVSNQFKQGVDQVLYANDAMGTPTQTPMDLLNFCLPGEVCFTSAPLYNNIFHPEGGGMIRPVLQADSVNEVSNDPAPGWYVGRFNNVEWTDSAADDVILAAHQIREDVCARINELLTGSPAIPQLTVEINKVLIDATRHANGPNADLDTTNCAACDGRVALCVKNAAGTIWSYYNVIEQQ